MSDPRRLQEVLAQLRARYLAASGETLATLTRLGERLERAPADGEAIEALRRELHRLHGTAGSYGLHDASRIAGAMEEVVVRWAKDPSDRERRAPLVRELVESLRDAFARSAEGPAEGSGLSGPA